MPRLAADSANTLASLTTYSTAYPTLLLPSANLSSSLLLLNSHATSLPGLLLATTALDLSSCGLGDSHDLLATLATLPHLATLLLAHNSLGEGGLRRLLLPRTLRLKHLDWTGNRLGPKGWARLASCSSLTSLVVGEEVQVAGGWRRMACPRLEVVHTRGWGEQVLEQWRRGVEEARQKVVRRAGGFYNRPVARPLGERVGGNRVMYCRVRQGCHQKFWIYPLFAKFCQVLPNFTKLYRFFYI